MNRYNGLERIAVGWNVITIIKSLYVSWIIVTITESLYVSQIVVTITESLYNDTLWFLWECFCLRIFLSIEMNRYNDSLGRNILLLFKLNLYWPIQPSLSLTKPKHNTVLIKLLYLSTSLGFCALVHLHVNPYTKLKQGKL
jgi:hypothetical protein